MKRNNTKSNRKEGLEKHNQSQEKSRSLHWLGKKKKKKINLLV